jgi:dTDP-4-dehydrorhamnose reductase
MRIVIIGAAGQLGTALQACLTGEVSPLTHAQIEITKPEQVDEVLSAHKPDCVINAAAYNFVDRAEDEVIQAAQVNTFGPKNLAQWCAKSGATLVHVSTDYVFGSAAGRSQPLSETDPPFPTCAYALSKLRGEKLVEAECSKHFIVRTCGLYGRASTAGKGNFVKTMRRLAQEGKDLSVVNDQHCTPSYAADIAGAISRLINTDAYGLYHATNDGGSTWYDFATEIFRLSNLNPSIRPVTSAEYPQKAKRPAYSVLDCRKLTALIGGPLPAWQDGLARYIAQLD